MHPVLFEIPLFGGLTVYTYGVLVASGFLAGILWVSYETRRLGLNTATALDLIFYIIISSIIGSRIMFLVLNDPGRLITEPWSIFMVWEGGLVFFGGLIAALAVSFFYFWKKKLPVREFLDVFAPALAIGHAFGRIGCLMAGCCYGRPSGDIWFSVVFPGDPNALAPAQLHLYPTQPLEGLGELLIFLGLVIFRKYKRFDGQVFAFYLIFYAILRFLNEYLRGDPERGYFVQDIISTAQGISIVLFGIGLTMLLYGYRKWGRNDE